jgi:hypothetical protein
MNHNGKIGHLPQALREELNERLEMKESAAKIAGWLNTLPEVRAMLAEHFGGAPFKQQNISEWSRGGYVEWQMRRAAMEFASNLKADNAAGPTFGVGDFADQLTQWIALRYGAAANSMAVAEQEDPDSALRRLRLLCQDVMALRRGELSAGRLRVLQQRLAREQKLSDQEKEKEFWEWTKRPEVQERLYPHRDPDKTRRQVEQMLNEKLLGIRRKDDPGLDETADPAVLI